jgi:hypothetical protein
MMHDREKSDSAIVAVKPTNKAVPDRSGAGGANGGGQGECEPAKHGPGRVQRRWSAYGSMYEQKRSWQAHDCPPSPRPSTKHKMLSPCATQQARARFSIVVHGPIDTAEQPREF